MEQVESQYMATSSRTKTSYWSTRDLGSCLWQMLDQIRTVLNSSFAQSRQNGKHYLFIYILPFILSFRNEFWVGFLTIVCHVYTIIQTRWTTPPLPSRSGETSTCFLFSLDSYFPTKPSSKRIKSQVPFGLLRTCSCEYPDKGRGTAVPADYHYLEVFSKFTPCWICEPRCIPLGIFSCFFKLGNIVYLNILGIICFIHACIYVRHSRKNFISFTT